MSILHLHLVFEKWKWRDSMNIPVLKGAAFVITHIPSFIRYGSKPMREIQKNPELLEKLLTNLRSFEDAVAYPPNQVFIGNMRPENLKDYDRPWTDKKVEGALRFSNMGELMPENEFYGFLKIADQYDLILLDKQFLKDEVMENMKEHPLFQPDDIAQLEKGSSIEEITEKVGEGALPLYINKDKLIGCVVDGHSEDTFLNAHIMLENLCNKASGIVAMRRVLHSFEVSPQEVDYVIGCDEEAVGDRYQRGGGNMAKSIAAHAGCINASGSDIKAFCCAPAHAVNIAAGLVQSGLYENILIIGGGCLAKLGMKYAGNLSKVMPITEDQLGSIAINRKR